jgi:U3 small nucleolar RNA-associated protein 21
VDLPFADAAQAIGHITSPVPFSLLPQGKTFQVTTALERTVQTYDVRKLNLLFVSSPPTPGMIARVVAHKDVVYVAFADTGTCGGGGVWIFKRGKKIGELQQPSQNWGARKELIVFGEWVVQAFAKALVVWRRETGEVYTEIEMGGKSGAATAVCHPSAYLNKLVVARRSGDLEIWNIKTRYLCPEWWLTTVSLTRPPARKSTPSSPRFPALQLRRTRSRSLCRVR